MAYVGAAKAKAAFDGGRFKLAADLYSEAIAAGRKYPELFRKHAKANIKRKNFTEPSATPMAYYLAAKAGEAFIDDHFELAVEFYSQAIAVDPKNPELLCDRAQANIKLKNFTEAVSDANKAIDLDPSNLKAYLRKGMACFSLHEYQTAKTAFEAGSIFFLNSNSLAKATEKTFIFEDARRCKIHRFTDWVKKCDKFIAVENVELPTVSSELCSTTKETKQVENGSNEVISTPAEPKYRHDFYQNPEEVIVAIYAEGISAKNVFVKYGEQILSVAINVPGEDEYILQPRLFGKIVPAKCRFEVLLTKVEIRLAKAESIRWTSLELGQNSVVDQRSNVCAGSSRPAGDWEMGVGDAASNKIFRDLYEISDEDTQRILKKSFLESNGTVLSTNWKKVRPKKVEGTPPNKWKSL